MKIVVFDMAGTVVNENNVVYKTLRKAIVDGGVSVTLDQVLADGAGKEKSDAIRFIVNKYAPQVDSEMIGVMYNNFLTLLNEAYETLIVTPISGAEEVFRELKKRDIFVVLNTGYQEKTANQLLSKLGWDIGTTFDELVTASDVTQARPHPDMILEAMKWLDVTDAKQVMKVGDSIVDIEEGKNAGCGLTIGITTGAHTRAQLESAYPDHIVDSLREILAFV
jgi:phosphonatase-like hydrolase